MRAISQKVRKQIAADPAYRTCMLKAHPGHVCGGRITMEHAMIVAGRQVDATWAIISCCARGQEVDHFQDAHTMDKNLNRWVALNRATDEILISISKAIDYLRERDRLNTIYGTYVPYVEPEEVLEIKYPELTTSETY